MKLGLQRFHPYTALSHMKKAITPTPGVIFIVSMSGVFLGLQGIFPTSLRTVSGLLTRGLKKPFSPKSG
jgi:hypothetical protein